jgi:hypothetical protein
MVLGISPPAPDLRWSVSFKKSVLYLTQDVGGKRQTFNFNPEETGGFHDRPMTGPSLGNWRVDYAWPGYSRAALSPDLTRAFDWKLSGIESTLDRKWFPHPRVPAITGTYNPPNARA